MNKLASQDWSDRDPKANRDAYQAFAELVQRYPNSKYAADATERMAKLVDALGGNEISVARYYMKRGAYVAAANRAQKIVSRYQNTRYAKKLGDDGLAIKNWTSRNWLPIHAVFWKPTSRKARSCNTNGDLTICLGGVTGAKHRVV